MEQDMYAIRPATCDPLGPDITQPMTEGEVLLVMSGGPLEDSGVTGQGLKEDCRHRYR
jgi:hypothetical protein